MATPLKKLGLVDDERACVVCTQTMTDLAGGVRTPVKIFSQWHDCPKIAAIPDKIMLRQLRLRALKCEHDPHWSWFCLWSPGQGGAEAPRSDELGETG